MTDTRKTELTTDPAMMIEKAFLMGLGVLDITREKVNDFTGELIERGRISQAQARDVADKMTAAADAERSSIKRVVAEETSRIMEMRDMATRADIDLLRAEIAELREMIATGMPGGTPPL